jgi:hypothetical protein
LTPDKKTEKRGRPRKEIDLAKVEAAAAFYATMDEIAAVLEVSPATAKRAARTLEFQEAYERGRAKCRYTLRRMQVELAESGNATMQIWLGKQILGQRDNVHVQQESVVQMQGTTSASDILRERLDALAIRLGKSDLGADNSANRNDGD